MNTPAVWQEFQRGDLVQVRADGVVLCQATIDDFNEDRSVIWVRLKELNERKILLFDEGVQIVPLAYVSSQELANSY